MSRTPPHHGRDDESDWSAEAPTVLKRSAVHKVGRRVEEVPVPRLTLVVRTAAGDLRVEHEGASCRVGSHASNDVVIKDRTVSRFHCRLVHDGVAWHVSDLGSSNGTWLDGVKVRDAELPAKGTLALGDATVVVRVEASGSSLLPSAGSYGAIVGASLAMQRLYALLERVVDSDASVLLVGERGTGKELIAGEIVQRGARAQAPLVVVDCSLPAARDLEAELFGDADRAGAFELASGGTLVLDEIGATPLELQPRLLRALEAREVRRAGEAHARPVDVRVIAATRRDLERDVNQGAFREDLYLRVAVVQLSVPPLRERRGDVPVLVRAFLEALGKADLEAALFPPPTMAELAAHDWPGNVRELRSHVERCVVLRERSAPRRASTPDAQALDAAPLLPFRLAKEGAIEDFERAYLTTLMARAAGNVSRAARQAGMDRMHLHHLLQKHGLKA